MSSSGDLELEPRAFRDVLGLFATGIAIIVSECGGEVRAMTANAVSSLSLDPMLMLFCPGKKSKMAQHVHQITHFSINFLRAEQQAQSTYFAGGWKESPAPPFRFVHWATGAPRLEGSLAALSCETQQVIDAGDHWLVIGRVLALHRGIEPCRPLLFFRGSYRHVDFSEGSPAPDLVTAEELPHVFYDP